MNLEQRRSQAPFPDRMDRYREDYDDGGRIPWGPIIVGVAVGAVASRYFYTRSIDRIDYDDDAPTTARKRPPEGRMGVVGRSVTINRPRGELYARWRDFPRLAEFMENVRAIREEDGEQIWTIAAPFDREIEVRTRLAEDRPDERIAWASVQDSPVRTEGSVTFRDAPGGRGTIVEAVVGWEPPAGELGRLIAKLFRRDPGVQGRHDLRRFKMLMETGEIATSRNRDPKED